MSPPGAGGVGSVYRRAHRLAGLHWLDSCAGSAVVSSTVAVLVLVGALLVPAAVVSAQGPGQAVPRGAWQPSVVIRWNAALIEAVRRTEFRPMWTARALAIVHTAIYDAWAAYDAVATGVHWDRDLRRPFSHTQP